MSYPDMLFPRYPRHCIIRSALAAAAIVPSLKSFGVF
jgi:hypothetical protein